MSTPPQSPEPPEPPQPPEAGPGVGPRVGRIVWRDLTVPDAEAAREFYREVVGWEARPHPMGEYADYDLVPPGGGEAVAGICHARGENANVPPQWLLYVWVADVRASAARCQALGGRVLDGPRPMGGQLFCAIRGPEGATLALVGSLAVGSAGSEEACPG